jgi:hypothetical protein
LTAKLAPGILDRMNEAQRLVSELERVGLAVRDAIQQVQEEVGLDLSALDADEGGDRIYRLDRISEDVLLERLGVIADEIPFVLVAEGLEGGRRLLPEGGEEGDARWWIIIDPVDGTRPLMYGKRSAWFLAGAAPVTGAQPPRLADLELAVQVELPPVKQTRGDRFRFCREEGLFAWRDDLQCLTSEEIELSPSTAIGLEDGYASVVRGLPGARDLLAAVEDELIELILGPRPAGRALVFEDQYLSTGGQMAELASGHDRFIADLRPWASGLEVAAGRPRLLTAHPYDLAAWPIAAAAGVILESPAGGRLDGPLDVESEIAWVGYANSSIRDLVRPALQTAMARHEAKARSKS